VHGDDGVAGLGDGADRPRQQLRAAAGVVRHADEDPVAEAAQQVAASIAALLDSVHVLNTYPPPLTVLAGRGRHPVVHRHTWLLRGR
jgi:hypothetical protein